MAIYSTFIARKPKHVPYLTILSPMIMTHIQKKKGTHNFNIFKPATGSLIIQNHKKNIKIKQEGLNRVTSRETIGEPVKVASERWGNGEVSM